MPRYLRSICTGLTSQSSWLLGLAGAVSSWKFSNVDMISWTFRFSSLISCHSWDPIPSQNAQRLFSVTVHHVAMLNLPAATSAADRRLGCRHTSWFAPAAPGRGHWPSCSSPAGRILGPASRSRWSLVNSWCCCCCRNAEEHHKNTFRGAKSKQKTWHRTVLRLQRWQEGHKDASCLFLRHKFSEKNNK